MTIKKTTRPFAEAPAPVFLPTSREELDELGWQTPDIILISGDSYIDSPFIGIAVIGRVLAAAGFRVAIIAQPDVNSGRDISRLGEPKLFWGISGGCVDSMVANYTATKKRRRSDDYTPGNINNRRPDRAVIIYANLVRKYFKNTRPIVLGGIEASLRRIAHYDFWSDRIRRSILCDAKADILVYGMGEKQVVELAAALKSGHDYKEIKGICFLDKELPGDCLVLPPYEEVARDKQALIRMFHLFYQNNDPLTARRLAQKQDSRCLVQNPPPMPLSSEEMDRIHALDFARDLHPWYRRCGPVRALETIRFSIPALRGCYGECNYCSIAVHQGRTVQWRSEESILAEAVKIAALPGFRGYILDLGGPTANMYGIECRKKLAKGACRKKRCLYPKVCATLKVDHGPQIRLLRRLRSLSGIKKVFVASGIRYDLLLADRKNGRAYLAEIVSHHVSGQLKVAPEHTATPVLAAMGKPGPEQLLAFKDLFDRQNKAAGKKQFLTYYLIAAHPGCTADDMLALKEFTGRELKINPEQVQIFTPTPSTYSSLMYYTGTDPFSGQPIFVEKDMTGKEGQKKIIIPAGHRSKRKA